MATFNRTLLLGYSEDDFEPEYWERIDRVTDTRVLLPKDITDAAKELRRADCLLVKLGATVDQAQMESAPLLRYIGMYGTGYGRIDTAYAAERGIPVCNVADYATEGVAEFTFAVVLSHLRELERAHRQAQGGDYSESTFTGTELRGRTFGIIGLGHIGRRVGEIAARGFAAKTMYWSRTRRPDAETEGLTYTQLDPLLSTADVISLNLALTPDTTGFLGESRLHLLKPGAILVNLSPMELLDLPAIEKRVRAGEVTLVLDHSDEMVTADVERLARHPGCLVYPPIAYTTEEATLRKKEIFVRNLENAASGVWSNKVN